MLTIPIRTVSALNVREHPMARHRRVKAERKATAWVLAPATKLEKLPAAVRLTRVGPSDGLDEGDNLNSSMKGVRDQVAEWLGINDRDPRVKWVYAQRRDKQWAVTVEFLEVAP